MTDTSHDKQLDAILERAAYVAGLNGQGIVSKEYSIISNGFEWCYGILRVPDSHQLRIKLGVTQEDTIAPWSLFRGAIRLLRSDFKRQS